jgi:hypothetical protein
MSDIQDGRALAHAPGSDTAYAVAPYGAVWLGQVDVPNSTRQVAAVSENVVSALALAADGRVAIATVDGPAASPIFGIRVVGTRPPIPREIRLPVDLMVRALFFVRNGTALAALHNGGSVHVWPLDGTRPFVLLERSREPPLYALSLTLAPGFRGSPPLLVATLFNRRLRAWRADTLALITSLI